MGHRGQITKARQCSLNGSSKNQGDMYRKFSSRSPETENQEGDTGYLGTGIACGVCFGLPAGVSEWDDCAQKARVEVLGPYQVTAAGRQRVCMFMIRVFVSSRVKLVRYAPLASRRKFLTVYHLGAQSEAFVGIKQAS